MNKFSIFLGTLKEQKSLIFSSLSIILTVIFSHLAINDKKFGLLSFFIWSSGFFGFFVISLIPLINANQKIKVLKQRHIL